ncbi:MAG: PAS domain-containing protein, partial [Candidatus Izemoplasmatales bacterium]
MSDIMIYIALGMGIVLIVMSTVFYHKFRIWKLILIILTSAAYAFLRLFPEIVDVYIPIDMTIEWYGYYLFLVVIILAINFKSKIKITQNLTDYDFFEMEKELDELKSTSELLRLRYISTIELLNEGMLFYNDTLDGFFASEQFGRITGITKSDMTIDEYVTLIHPDDQNQYLSTIKKANRKTPSFDIKYRISRD